MTIARPPVSQDFVHEGGPPWLDEQLKLLFVELFQTCRREISSTRLRSLSSSHDLKPNLLAP